MMPIAVAIAQPSSELSQEWSDTPARGYWVDPSTHLMWAAKDNGRNVNWHQAATYCGNLKFSRYDDWRMPTIGELEGVSDFAVGARQTWRPGFHIKGGLFLTGESWSATDLADADGRPTEWALLFDFQHGRSFVHAQDFRIGKRALCVRGKPPAESFADHHPPAWETLLRGYWVDPTTELMWAGRDNFGRDLNWRQAEKYCLGLRVAGYADWRMPTIVELENIFDAGAHALGLAGKRNDTPQSFHVKGGLFLTGNSWSASDVHDREPRLTGWAYHFDFVNGGRFFHEELWFHTGKRALCVRGIPHDPGQVPAAAVVE